MSPIQYVNAMEAARIIGVSDRTIREWVKNNTLSAHHPAKNRLAIPIHEVEALARERRQYQMNVPDASELGARVSELEQRVIQLEQRLKELAEQPTPIMQALTSPSTAMPYGELQPTRARRTTGKREEPGRELPTGCILATDFALHYNVNRVTFRDHMIKGLRGERVEVSERPKPGREKETERYLTPEQQERALDFWVRHGVPFQENATIREEEPE